MPHLTLEYTDNLVFDADTVLLAANRRLAESGHFVEVDIKSRARRLDTWRVGTAEFSPGDSARGFVHATLALLPGRNDATKAALSALLLDVLRDHLPAVRAAVQLCVSVEEIHGPAYAKATIEPTATQ